MLCVAAAVTTVPMMDVKRWMNIWRH